MPRGGRIALQSRMSHFHWIEKLRVVKWRSPETASGKDPGTTMPAQMLRASCIFSNCNQLTSERATFTTVSLFLIPNCRRFRRHRFHDIFAPSILSVGNNCATITKFKGDQARRSQANCRTMRNFSAKELIRKPYYAYVSNECCDSGNLATHKMSQSLSKPRS